MHYVLQLIIVLFFDCKDILKVRSSFARSVPQGRRTVCMFHQIDQACVPAQEPRFE